MVSIDTLKNIRIQLKCISLSNLRGYFMGYCLWQCSASNLRLRSLFLANGNFLLHFESRGVFFQGSPGEGQFLVSRKELLCSIAQHLTEIRDQWSEFKIPKQTDHSFFEFYFDRLEFN